MSLTISTIKPPNISWSPITTLGLASSVGSYLGTVEHTVNYDPFIFIGVSIVITIVGLVFLRKHQFLCLVVSFITLFFGRSILAANDKAPIWISVLSGDIVEIVGEVVTNPITQKSTVGEMAPFDYKETTTRFVVDAKLHTKNKITQTSSQIIVVCGDRVMVSPGDIIICCGWLRNSNNTNQKTKLFISNNNSIQVTQIKPKKNIKHKARTLFLRNLTGEEKTLANALFFGIRDTGWRSLSERFRRSGMSHILAISGMHIALFVLLISAILFLFGVSRTTSIFITLATTFFILYLVEIRPPVIRAVLMLVMFLLINLLKIKCNTISLLGLAAIFVLVLFPRDAGTVGFQLSFIVVASLCTILPRMVWRIAGTPNVNSPIKTTLLRWAGTVWLTGLCAWLVSTPITMHTFGTLSPSGIISNIPSVAILLMVLWAGIVSALFQFLEMPCEIVQRMFSASLVLLINTAELFNNTPLGFLEIKRPPWIVSAALFVIVVLWIAKIKHRGKTWAALLTTIFLCVFVIQTKSNDTVITTLDVGHGTCHIIQHKTFTMMIDGGSRNNLDVGRNKISPKLKELGISHIDTVVITHSDIDHIAGVIDVVKTVSVGKILMAPQTANYHSAPLARVINSILKEGIQIVLGSEGWKESFGDITIKMLSPNLRDNPKSTNAASIVLLIESHQRRVLFTGDIDEGKILELTKTLKDTIDVMELPHHGQWSEESNRFVFQKHPGVIIQSTNKSRHAKDRWFFPNNTHRFVTAVDGTITTTIKPSGSISVVGSKDPVTMPPCLLHH